MRRSTVLILSHTSVRVPWTYRLSILQSLTVGLLSPSKSLNNSISKDFFQLFCDFATQQCVLRNRPCKRNFSLFIRSSLCQGDQKFGENHPNLGKRSQNS
jgi:hypothetical protein